MNKPILNLREVADYLGVSPTSIYRYVKQKKMPAMRVGSQWRFRREKIDAWLEKMENNKA